MNIAAYCRVSTDKDDQLNSLEAQKRFFDEYTKKNNYNLIKIYADEGISGTKIKNRKQFLQLMSDAKQGNFDMVVVKDISRFARNTVDFLNSIRSLKALNIETVFLTSNQTVLGNSEFVLTIFGALAQEESANTSKRVRFGKRLNAQKGRVPNIVYGYDKTKGDYFNLSINEKEAVVVRKIFEYYVNEGYGANKIAQALNKQGIKTKRGCKWSQNAVARILSNEIYIGRVINGKQEVEDFLTGVRRDVEQKEWFVVDKPELKIVDYELFKKAGEIIKKRQTDFNINQERQSNKHVLSTIIKCKNCGYSFRRTERVYQNVYIKWVCSGRNANGSDSCNNTIKIDENEIMTEIRKYFIETIKAKDDYKKLITKELKKIYFTQDENINNKKELSDKLCRAKKTRQKYIEMYSEELITKEELNEKLCFLKKEIDEYESELRLLKANLSTWEVLDNKIDNLFDTSEYLFDTKYFTNAQLKKIIDRIVVFETGDVNINLCDLSLF